MAEQMSSKQRTLLEIRIIFCPTNSQVLNIFSPNRRVEEKAFYPPLVNILCYHRRVQSHLSH